MVRYECDFCHRLKAPDETWILGFALENIGVTAARREIVIASAWDPKRAVEPLAVLFLLSGMPPQLHRETVRD